MLGTPRNRCRDSRCAGRVVLEVNVAITTSGSSQAFRSVRSSCGREELRAGFERATSVWRWGWAFAPFTIQQRKFAQSSATSRGACLQNAEGVHDIAARGRGVQAVNEHPAHWSPFVVAVDGAPQGEAPLRQNERRKARGSSGSKSGAAIKSAIGDNQPWRASVGALFFLESSREGWPD